MNIDIFKDLLPNYLEGLTSSRTNEAIEAYLLESEEAKKYYDKITHELELNINEEEIESNYKYNQFKKIKKENIKKIFLISSLLITSFIIIFSIYVYLFGTSWTPNYNDVIIEKSQVNNNVKIVIKPKNNRHFLLPYNDTSINENRTFTVNEMRQDFSTPEILKKGIVINYKFKNKDTIIDVYGKEKDISNKYLTIKFNDRTLSIKLDDLFQRKG